MVLPVFAYIVVMRPCEPSRQISASWKWIFQADFSNLTAQTSLCSQVAFSQCPEPFLHDSITICSCKFELQIAWNIFSFLRARYAIHDTNVLLQIHPALIPLTLLLPYIYARLILSSFIWAINHSMVSHLKIKRITGLWTWQVISSYWTTWQGIFFFSLVENTLDAVEKFLSVV